MSSLSLQRLKLYHKLAITQSVTSHSSKGCCTTNMTDEELFMLDEAFALRSTLSETDESALYYISGCVAKEENITPNSNDMDSYAGMEYPCSEFTTLLSRGNLTHPHHQNYLNCLVFYIVTIRM